jgi:hypothetical protein
VCDNKHALIRLEEVRISDNNNISMDVYLENKSKTQTLSFFTWTAAINGIQIDPYYGEDIEPSKSKVATIDIPSSYLEMCQIDEITKISVTFVAYDAENVEEEFLAEGTIVYYPYGEENVEEFKLAMDSSYDVLMDQDGIKVVSLGFQDTDAMGYAGMLYIQNDSERCITTSIDTSEIDGVASEIFAYLEVDAGNIGFLEMYWSGALAEEYDDDGNLIEKEGEAPDPATAKDIKVELSVYDTDDWEADQIFYEMVDVK